MHSDVGNANSPKVLFIFKNLLNFLIQPVNQIWIQKNHIVAQLGNFNFVIVASSQKL